MTNKLKATFYGLLFGSSLLLGACGGSNDNESNLSTDRPHFDRAKAVVGTEISPLGEISSTNPTFTWKYNRKTGVNVHSPFKIGFESTDGSGWQEFTVDRDCEMSPQTGNMVFCSGEVPYEFSEGSEIAWWVAYDTRDGWRWNNDTYVFSVAGDGGNASYADFEPSVEFKSTNDAHLYWNNIENASDYQLSYEVAGNSDWISFKVGGSDAYGGDAGERSRYATGSHVSKFAISSGDVVTWWVRALIDGEWSNWSSGSEYTVPDDGSSNNNDPFAGQSGISDPVQLNGEWFAIKDGKSLVSEWDYTLYTSEYTEADYKDSSISNLTVLGNKLYFVELYERLSPYRPGSFTGLIAFDLDSWEADKIRTGVSLTIEESTDSHIIIDVSIYRGPKYRARIETDGTITKI